MRKILLFGVLLFAGCSKNSSGVQHEIICMDNNYKVVTIHVITAGNVDAFVVFKRALVSYRDVDTNELRFIDLSKNDCVIE